MLVAAVCKKLFGILLFFVSIALFSFQFHFIPFRCHSVSFKFHLISFQFHFMLLQFHLIAVQFHPIPFRFHLVAIQFHIAAGRFFNHSPFKEIESMNSLKKGTNILSLFHLVPKSAHHYLLYFDCLATFKVYFTHH